MTKKKRHIFLLKEKGIIEKKMRENEWRIGFVDISLSFASLDRRILGFTKQIPRQKRKSGMKLF